MAKGQAGYHRELVREGLDGYLESLRENWRTVITQGTIAGIEKVRPSSIRRFYESTEDDYWSQLAQNDPEEALRQVQEFQEVSRDNA